jgi:hypothetical protein
MKIHGLNIVSRNSDSNSHAAHVAVWLTEPFTAGVTHTVDIGPLIAALWQLEHRTEVAVKVTGARTHTPGEGGGKYFEIDKTTPRGGALSFSLKSFSFDHVKPAPHKDPVLEARLARLEQATGVTDTRSRVDGDGSAPEGVGLKPLELMVSFSLSSDGARATPADHAAVRVVLEEQRSRSATEESRIRASVIARNAQP